MLHTTSADYSSHTLVPIKRYTWKCPSCKPPFRGLLSAVAECFTNSQRDEKLTPAVCSWKRRNVLMPPNSRVKSFSNVFRESQPKSLLVNVLPQQRSIQDNVILPQSTPKRSSCK